MNKLYMNDSMSVLAAGNQESSPAEPAEEKRKKYLKEMEASPTPSNAEDFTDDQLLAILNSFGFDLNRDSFYAKIKDSYSTDEIFESLLEKSNIDKDFSNFDAEWLYFSMEALWKRWFPNCIAAQHIQSKILDGEIQLVGGDVPGAVKLWLEGWALLVALLEVSGWKTINEYETRFPDLMYSIPRWIINLQELLREFGRFDRKHLKIRVLICEKTLKMLPARESHPDYAEYQYDIKELRQALTEAKKAHAAKPLIKHFHSFMKTSRLRNVRHRD